MYAPSLLPRNKLLENMDHIRFIFLDPQYYAQCWTPKCVQEIFVAWTTEGLERGQKAILEENSQQELRCGDGHMCVRGYHLRLAGRDGLSHGSSKLGLGAWRLLSQFLSSLEYHPSRPCFWGWLDTNLSLVHFNVLNIQTVNSFSHRASYISSPE